MILAPGVKHEKPSIGNLEVFEGQGVSYCVTCDAPFFKDKKVGLVGSKDYAAKEALELYEFTENITILTNGKEPKIREDLKKKIDDKDIEINCEKVEEIFGDEKLQGVILESGKMDFEGLFIAVGTSGSVDFARSLGVPVEGNSIVVDENLSTGLPRLYAAGDCIEEKRQISIAAGGGAKAALNLIEEMREKNTLTGRRKVNRIDSYLNLNTTVNFLGRIRIPISFPSLRCLNTPIKRSPQLPFNHSLENGKLRPNF